MESLSWVADVLASYRGDGRPAHIYVRSDGPGLSFTRDQLREQVARRAGALAGRGVAAGDHVGLLAGETDAFMPTFLALLWLGGRRAASPAAFAGSPGCVARGGRSVAHPGVSTPAVRIGGDREPASG
jgi:acyl-coenzyme A synthetase/AMP-(fatty) acid ligase